jgi:osmotically-inducible protein OsmY
MKANVRDQDQVIKAVRTAMGHEPRINLHRFPVRIAYSADDEVLTLEGEVEHVAAKKLSLELAIAVPGVKHIVDRLRVVPATHMGDGAIRDAVRDVLMLDHAFDNCTIKVRVKGAVEIVRDSLFNPHGVIELSVTDGVVLLDDHVTSLIQKRLAGVLAWWVPGSRDVINAMDVVPTPQDDDAEVTKALKLVLDKNPLVDARDIRVSTRQWVVTLEGSVPTEAQKNMAEWDAWYVFGVDKVLNGLLVR